MTALAERFAPQGPKRLLRRLPPEPGSPADQGWPKGSRPREVHLNGQGAAAVRPGRHCSGVAACRRRRRWPSGDLWAAAVSQSGGRGNSTGGAGHHAAGRPRTKAPAGTRPRRASLLTCSHTRLTSTVDAPGPRGPHLSKRPRPGPRGGQKTAPATCAVPCRTAPPMPPHAKIRAGCGPTRLHSQQRPQRCDTSRRRTLTSPAPG